MMRLATLDDVSEIVALGTVAYSQYPYGEVFGVNATQSELLTRKIIEEHGKVLLWEVDGKIVGLLAFILFDHFFSGERTAQEVMWFVSPEHRAGGAAMHLFWEAHKMAFSLGAKKMQCTAPTEAVGTIYKRYGYKQVEVAYQRSLPCQG